jgi:hypothetical protein
MFQTLKSILPDHPMPLRIWRGPLRGGRAVMNPRNSLRKIFGLYEHELNDWLESVLRLTNRVIDVGANDGYFTFGCAAAFRRLGKKSEIVAFEPETEHFASLSQSVQSQPQGPCEFTLIHSFAGATDEPDFRTLDSLPQERNNTLIKIDVEGAEEEVLAGASSWLRPDNYFLIEVHKPEFLLTIPRLFATHGLVLDQINQRPLKLIGRELRDEQNWWLVSRLPAANRISE